MSHTLEHAAEATNHWLYQAAEIAMVLLVILIIGIVVWMLMYGPRASRRST